MLINSQDASLMLLNEASLLLRPAGVLYGMIMTVRNRLFDRGILPVRKAPIPVVSVGNITTGGTGKTPLVDWIVKFYNSAAIPTAIISRGYGRKTRGVQLVSDGIRLLLGSHDAGDEAVMLSVHNPASIVIVAEKRMDGVAFLMQHCAERLPGVIVLDDAFQHRYIARDLDIVVINASEPRELNAMLPEGRLREPLQGLKRAGLIIFSKITDETNKDRLQDKLPLTGKPVIRSQFRPGALVRVSRTANIDENDPEPSVIRALAFAGIGAPSGFLHTLQEAGVTVSETRWFRDHEAFTEENIREIISAAAYQNLVPVTTEKDWFRISDNQTLRAMLSKAGCRYLTIRTVFPDGTAVLEQQLLSILKKN
jgi:tetraacyldisaccharide 4'-kinase